MTERPGTRAIRARGRPRTRHAWCARSWRWQQRLWDKCRVPRDPRRRQR